MVALKSFACASSSLPNDLGSLKEIDELLQLLEPMSCSKTRKIAAAKLDFVDERIRELQGLRNEFSRLLAACDSNTDTHAARSSSASRGSGSHRFALGRSTSCRLARDRPKAEALDGSGYEDEGRENSSRPS